MATCTYPHLFGLSVRGKLHIPRMATLEDGWRGGKKVNFIVTNSFKIGDSCQFLPLTTLGHLNKIVGAGN